MTHTERLVRASLAVAIGLAACTPSHGGSTANASPSPGAHGYADGSTVQRGSSDESSSGENDETHGGFGAERASHGGG